MKHAMFWHHGKAFCNFQFTADFPNPFQAIFQIFLALMNKIRIIHISAISLNAEYLFYIMVPSGSDNSLLSSGLFRCQAQDLSQPVPLIYVTSFDYAGHMHQ